MAYFLAVATYNVRGDAAVTGGWLERARRLLDGLEPGVEGALVVCF